MRLENKHLKSLNNTNNKCVPWTDSYRYTIYMLQTNPRTSIVDTIGVNIWWEATRFREDIKEISFLNLMLT